MQSLYMQKNTRRCFRILYREGRKDIGDCHCHTVICLYASSRIFYQSRWRLIEPWKIYRLRLYLQHKLQKIWQLAFLLQLYDYAKIYSLQFSYYIRKEVSFMIVQLYACLLYTSTGLFICSADSIISLERNNHEEKSIPFAYIINARYPACDKLFFHHGKTLPRT